jgi:hypothetical protein
LQNLPEQQGRLGLEIEHLQTRLELDTSEDRASEVLTTAQAFFRRVLITRPGNNSLGQEEILDY